MTFTLSDLGWSSFFAGQCDPDAFNQIHPFRLTAIHRDRVTGLGADGTRDLITSGHESTGAYAVGDWVLADDHLRIAQLLERKTLIQRRAAGTGARAQLIAANLDTLYIVSSCNADFNPSRLERYLALAQDAGCYPVVVLTKADQSTDAADYRRQAEALAPYLTVLTVNALDLWDLNEVANWCAAGQTAALVGSSGVGKTTLLNGLTGSGAETAGIREDDARGRHTTTSRALRRMRNGGWLIDTPGMRALRLLDSADGIDSVFSDLAELATECRFSDCQHQSEPGCAIQAAIAAGDLDAARLTRWEKLKREDARNSQTIAEARAESKAFGRKVRRIMQEKKSRTRS